MGRFSHIKQLHCKIKKEMIERILGNQELLKYIYYPSPNPLNEDDVEDTISLINSYVFKRSKALKVGDEAQNYLFVKISSSNTNNTGIFKELNIIFDIICHNDLIDNLDDGSDRSLVILDYLDEMFDDSTSQFWIGGMQYIPFKELYINDSYSGYRLTYKVTI